ncbi:MAG: lipoprotein-releasing ABC transporter permease subunit [Kiloniellales bacterium]
MFSRFERMVGMRYLRARRGTGFLSVIAFISLLGIFIGVATLIIVMAVMNGFRHELLTRFLGLNGHISVVTTGGRPFTDYQAVAERLSAMEHVVSVSPQAEGQVLVITEGGAGGAILRGLEPEDLMARPILSEHIVAGSLDDFQGKEAVIIGRRMARTFQVKVGDRLTLFSPHFIPTAIGRLPRHKSYRVAGLFEVEMYEYDSRFIYMPLEAAQVFLKLGQAVSSLDVILDDADMSAEMRRRMFRALGADYRVIDLQRVNTSLFNALQVERNVMFLILTLIILVAAFNMISSLIMMVKDKGRDIAVLRSMGATRGMILRIFLLSGASVGIFGTALGAVAGVVFAENIETIRQWIQGLIGTELFAAEIYFFTRLPADNDWTEVAAVVAMALMLSFLATIYPSWRAARLDPVEALRYE